VAVTVPAPFAVNGKEIPPFLFRVPENDSVDSVVDVGAVVAVVLGDVAELPQLLMAGRAMSRMGMSVCRKDMGLQETDAQAGSNGRAATRVR